MDDIGQGCSVGEEVGVVVTEKSTEDVFAEGHGDGGTLFGEDETLAEVASVVAIIEQAVNDADLVGDLGD